MIMKNKVTVMDLDGVNPSYRIESKTPETGSDLQ